MMVQIQVLPETAAKFQAAAEALNLSVQDYLERLAADLVLIASIQEDESNQQQQKTPYELGKEFIGSIDSSVPDPFVSPHQTVFGEILVEKYRKQGLQLP